MSLRSKRATTVPSALHIYIAMQKITKAPCPGALPRCDPALASGGLDTKSFTHCSLFATLGKYDLFSRLVRRYHTFIVLARIPVEHSYFL